VARRPAGRDQARERALFRHRRARC
jgi:hypothetical protein